MYQRVSESLENFFYHDVRHIQFQSSLPRQPYEDQPASTLVQTPVIGEPQANNDGILFSEPQPQAANQLVSAPPAHVNTVQTPVIGKPWATGLFDCHENQTNAVMTSLLPCVTFGLISEVLDEGEMTCPTLSSIYLLLMPVLCSQWVLGSRSRTKLRKKYGLVEAPFGDVASHVFCPCCSLCQEFRELQKRDLDPALGWNGIQAQQNVGMEHQGQPNIVPPTYQEMNK